MKEINLVTLPDIVDFVNKCLILKGNDINILFLTLEILECTVADRYIQLLLPYCGRSSKRRVPPMLFS